MIGIFALLLLTAPATAGASAKEERPTTRIEACLWDQVRVLGPDERWVVKNTVKTFEELSSPLLPEAEARLAELPERQWGRDRNSTEHWREIARKEERQARATTASFAPGYLAKAAHAQLQAGDRKAADRLAAEALDALRGDAGQDPFAALPALCELSRLRARTGRISAAVELILRAQKLLPRIGLNTRVSAHRNVAEAWLILGRKKAASRQVAAAKTVAREAVRQGALDPRGASSDLLHLGRMLVREGEIPLALGLLDGLPDPGSHDLLLNHYIEVAGYDDRCEQMLGFARRVKGPSGRIRELLRVLRSCPAFDPVAEVEATLAGLEPAALDVVARKRLVELYVEQDRLEAAEPWARSLDSKISRGRGLAELARGWAKRGVAKKARPAAEEAVKLAREIRTNGDQISILNDAVAALYGIGDIEAADAARAVVPGVHDPPELHAHAYLQRGDLAGVSRVIQSQEKVHRRLNLTVLLLRESALHTPAGLQALSVACPIEGG